jgi:UDPglucose 6-dehydrogenase
VKKNPENYANASGKIMIIGSGIVGQATGKGLIKRGIRNIIFVDTDPLVLENLSNEGYNVCHLDNIDNEIENVVVSMFCLPTPFDQNLRKSDLKHVNMSLIRYAESLKKRIKKQQYNLIVIRSTVVPGTTEKFLIPLIEKHSGMKIGTDFGICMQPEFLRSLTSEQDFMYPRTIIIGQYDEQSGRILEELYIRARFEVPIIKVGLSAAEFIKFTANYFNATKISFANEMWCLGEKLGIDPNISLEIATTVAEGFWNPLYGTHGGRPFGGRCLPKDIECLLSFCQEINAEMPLLKAVHSVNSMMKQLVSQDKTPKESIQIERNISQLDSAQKSKIITDGQHW